MNIVPIGRYRFFQKIEPINLLKKISIQSFSGCLQVVNRKGTWKIYCQNGRVVYASQTEITLELLYKQLNKYLINIHQSLPEVNSYIHTSIKDSLESQTISTSEYIVICWLVKNKYINLEQVSILIENIVIEIFKLLLNISEGSYDFHSQSCLGKIPIFCELDMKQLVDKTLKIDEELRFSMHRNNISDDIIEHMNIPQNFRLRHTTHFISRSKSSINVCDYHLPSQKREKKLYKIVCIDDDPIVLRTIYNFLNEEIFIVVGIIDPLKALVQLMELEPDLILLDIEMPNLDGYEFCSLLQNHPYFRNIPVIIISGRSGFFDRAKAKIVRATDYLTKPFTQLELIKSIFHNLKYFDNK